MGDYLQKRLDNAEADVRREFQERWNILDQAVKHLAAECELEVSSEQGNMKTLTTAKKVFAGEDSVGRSSHATEFTKVVPIVETWTQCFDEATQCAYFVSSLGNSTWETPSGLHH